ncbi:MAG: hypothetical protein HKL90_11025 [Elusimicrobia bacterium]|nr:hypothetical protein [Elusimicrobiota bacterium]
MKKRFDSVKFQREARRKLGSKYPASRAAEFLLKLEQKYGHLQKRKALQFAAR